MTLDAILTGYQDGTLANEPDSVLIDASVKVDMYYAWQEQHPDYKGEAIPGPDRLRQIIKFIDTLLAVRYGCND